MGKSKKSAWTKKTPQMRRYSNCKETHVPPTGLKCPFGSPVTPSEFASAAPMDDAQA